MKKKDDAVKFGPSTLRFTAHGSNVDNLAENAMKIALAPVFDTFEDWIEANNLD